jgi:NitT/TauT family transport system substrate-binding protein
MLATALLTLSACGGGTDTAGDAAASGSSGQLREVTVGMLPILPTAALYAGIDQGFFADHGIELRMGFSGGRCRLLRTPAR